MNLKKLLLLTGVIAALGAVTAPAAQAKSQWLTDPLELALEGNDAFQGVGKLTASAGPVLVTGPMEVFTNGILWNGEIHGEGKVEAFKPAEEEIPTNLPGCKATEAEAGNLPWQIVAETENLPLVQISKVVITYKYNAVCMAFGIPPVMVVEGELTGPFNNENGCLEYVNAPGLTTGGGAVKVLMNGAICIKGNKGNYTVN